VEKQCTLCKVVKPLAEFYSKDGRRPASRCIACLRPLMVERQKEQNRRERLRVLIIYGGDPPRCACCGERTLEFLTIDHVDKDGANHRRLLKSNTGRVLYRWLKKAGYPTGFRILCMNCNLCFGMFGYCPHQRNSELVDGAGI